MAAYLRLFARVFEEGEATEVVAWRHMLEEETGVGVPLWEVMFQLMAHPVPQVFPYCPVRDGILPHGLCGPQKLLSRMNVLRTCFASLLIGM
jgi:hypothetical protein